MYKKSSKNLKPTKWDVNNAGLFQSTVANSKPNRKVSSVSI